MEGFATPEGTNAYRNRFKGKLDASHFREKAGLWFSSIGIGSYLGHPDEATDRLYEEALKAAVRSGVNVIDSAINYREQRSERSFGKALAELFKSGEFKREELILCTKGGFLPENPDPYLKTGLIKEEELAAGCHCISPEYLEDQLQKSLANLGVSTLDIYYLHNPETQLEHGRSAFMKRMRLAFEWLEKKVEEGKIRFYGTATWNGYRVSPQTQDYLSIEELMVLAREAAGTKHHFKAVQLPLNLAMPEAWVSANQAYGANLVPFLGISGRYDLIVVASASLLQARLTGPLPEFLNSHFPNLPKSSQRALQFVRSVPGITTALVGMKNTAHILENLEVARVPALAEEQLLRIFQNAG